MKNKLFLSLILGTVLCLSGCNMNQGPSSSEPNNSNKASHSESDNSIVKTSEKKNPVTIEVKRGENFDLDTLVSYFYDTTIDALTTEGFVTDTATEVIYNKSGIELIYNETENAFTFCDWQKLKENGYGGLLPQQLLYNEIVACLMEWPLENELKNDSSQTAIEACKSLATACGYDDAHVTSYAITFSDLWKAAWLVTPDENIKNDVNYDKRFIRTQEIQDASNMGNIELGMQLTEQKHSMEKYILENTNNLEAYLLVYHSYMNGLKMDDIAHRMWCIYVPQYDTVIAASAGCSLVMTGIENKTELISTSRALEAALSFLPVESSDDLTFTDIEMVYSIGNGQAESITEIQIINPCWKIGYLIDVDKVTDGEYSEGDNVILIDAVSGIQVQ